MKSSFFLAALLSLALAALLGCGRPQAIVSPPAKRVYVDLDSLLPLHPSYSLLLREADTQSVASAQRRQEPVAASAPRSFSQPLLRPAEGEARIGTLPLSSILQSLADDRAATLIALKTVVESRRRAGADILEDDLRAYKGEAFVPHSFLVRQAIEAHLYEIIGLEARLAVPNLPEEAREKAEEKLKSLRRERQAHVEAEQRTMALESARFWTGGRLAIERRLTEYDTSVRTGAESALAQRTEQTQSDLQALERALQEMAAPRPAAVERMTVVTTSARTVGAFPSLGRERHEDLLARVRREVVAAVEHLAARNSWHVSFAPQAGGENVTQNVARILAEEFYPKR